jgi:hypothetical protein
VKKNIVFYLIIFILAIIIVAIIVVIGYLYYTFNLLEEALAPVCSSKVLSFYEGKKNIYLKTNMWGIGGNNYCIFLTTEVNEYVHPDPDIIFYRLELFYKIIDDKTLLIFLANGTREERIMLNDIEIIIKHFSPYYDDLEMTYENNGFNKINVYNVKKVTVTRF